MHLLRNYPHIPTGPSLYEGRYWQLTTDNRIYFYSGGQIRMVVNAEDLNRFGALVGGHDASTGIIPTQGSGVDSLGGPDLSIEAGDSLENNCCRYYIRVGIRG